MGHPTVISPRTLCNPLARMEIRFDGINNVGGLQTIDGARFGWVRDGGNRPHQGIDLYAEPLTPVYAVATGKIEWTSPDVKGYGKSILMSFQPSDHVARYLGLSVGGSLYALYAHLDKITKTSGKVQRHEVIGQSGTSGRTDQNYPHLHFEIWISNPAGKGLTGRINPELLFRTIDYSKPYEALRRIKNTA